MLGYVTIGVSDMDKAKAFYTPIAEALGGTALFGFPRIQFFGKSMAEATFAVCATPTATSSVFTSWVR